MTHSLQPKRVGGTAVFSNLSLFQGVFLFIFILSSVHLGAQGAFGTDETRDFTGFEGLGFTEDPTTGQLDSDDWYIGGFNSSAYEYGGDNTADDYARGGTDGTGKVDGGIYGYDSGALWIQPGGNDFTPGHIIFVICNNTGTVIEDVDVEYDILVLNDQNRANYLNFSYSLDNSTWIDVPSLNYTSPETAATSPEVETFNRLVTLTGVNIPDGGCFYARWSGDDVSGGGSRDEFGLDNITISEAVATCSFTGGGLDNINCDDAGTAGDASDDTFTFTLNPTGDNLGSTYDVSGDVTMTAVAYGDDVEIGGPYLISDGDLDITITDMSTDCSIDVTVAAPATCSSLTCDGASEFAYDQAAYCKNESDPTPTHTTGQDGYYSYTVSSGGPTLSLNAATGVIDLSASDPGVYTVDNQVNVSGCIDNSTFEVTINEVPELPVVSSITVCDGGATEIAPTEVGTIVFNFYEDAALTSLVSGGSLTYDPGTTAATSPDEIWVTATDGTCESGAVQVTITVNELPTVVIGGEGVCEGGTISLTESGGDAVSWTWTGPDRYTSTDQNPNIRNATSANAGDYTVTIVDGNNCTASATVSITVSPVPAVPNIPSDLTFCEGETTLLAPTPVSTELFNFYGNDRLTDLLSGPGASYDSETTVADSPETIWVTAVDGDCESEATQVVVTVNSMPTVVAEGSDVCVGENIILFETGGEATSWSWTGPNGFISTDQNPATEVATMDMAGDYVVTGTANDCETSSTISIAVNEAPEAPEVSDLTVCDGESTLIEPVAPGASATCAATGDLIITGVVDGTVNGGRPKVIELYVINDIADLSIYGLGSANNGNGGGTQEFTFFAEPAAAGTYIWVSTSPSDEFVSFFGFSPSYVDGVANINGDDAVELFLNGVAVDVFGDINTDGSGEPWEYTDGWAYRNNNTADGTTFNLSDWTFSGIDALDGEISNADAAIPFPISSYQCDLGTEEAVYNFYDADPGVGTATLLAESVPSYDPETTVATSPQTIWVTTDNGTCESEAVSVTVTVNSLPTVVAEGSDVCAGQDILLTETGGAATSWSWTGPGDFVSTEQNPTIAGATEANAGTYTVEGTDANGCAASADVAIVVNALPSVVAGGDDVCLGNDIALTETGGEATSWSWTGPEAFASTEQNPTITGATEDNAGDYIVEGTDDNGCSASSTVTIAVSPLPDAPVVEDITVCDGESTLIVPPAIGGGSGDCAATGDLIITGVVDGTVNGGRPKVIELYVINDIADLSIYGLGSANNGNGGGTQEFTFFAEPATAGTYIWVSTSPSDEFVSFFGFSPSYVDGVANINGDDAVELFLNGVAVDVFGDINTDGSGEPWEYADGWAYRNNNTADGITFNLSDWTFSGPDALDGEISNADAATPFPISSYQCDSGTGEGVYNFYDADPGVGTATLLAESVPSYDPETTVATSPQTIWVTIDNGTCESEAVSVTVTVNSLPTVVAEGSDVCAGQDILLTETGGAATSWSWTGPEAFASTEQNPTIAGATEANAGTYTVEGTDANGCAASADVAIVVNALPSVVAGGDDVCLGNDIALTETGGEATSWSWTGPEAFASTEQNPTITGATEDNAGDYIVEGTDDNGCSASSTVTIAVSPLPDAPVVEDITVCDDESTLIVPPAIGGGSGGCVATGDLIITGVVDGTVNQGRPKAVEFYAVNDIADLSVYGFGSANNGGGSDGEEFTFPADAVAAGTYFWLSTTPTDEFETFFGFAPTYTNSVANINGDDAIELFLDGAVVDVFGDINTDGTGQPWEYKDGWAYRNSQTGQSTTFNIADWSFSGPDALDGETSNADAATPFPISTYQCDLGEGAYNFYDADPGVGTATLLAELVPSYDPGTTVATTPQSIWVTLIENGCEGPATEVVVTVVAESAANAGDDQMICGLSDITLSATASGAGTWSGGVGTFADATSPNTIYTPDATEEGTAVVLTWSTTNAVCGDAVDDVTLSIMMSIPDVEFSYEDDEVCPGADSLFVLHAADGVDGRYYYSVISGGPNLDINEETGAINVAGSDGGTYEVSNGVSGCSGLVLSGVVDGDLPGGQPKAVELYALEDIPDLSVYGLGVANNGGGTDGEEFTLPAEAVAAGGYIYVAADSAKFREFFGFDADFIAENAIAVSGDDAVELFCRGMVTDVFGEIDVDGTGQPWEYKDGWAYRVNNTGPDGSVFDINNWTFSGPNALDDENANSTAATPMPVGTFVTDAAPVCASNIATFVIAIEDNQPPVVSCPNHDLVYNLAPGECGAYASFLPPAVSDNCPGEITVVQVAGPASGTFLRYEDSPYTVVFEVTDANGNGPVICSYDIVVNEYIPTSSVLICNSDLQISFEDNCEAVVSADMILEGNDYGCYDDYVVTILDQVMNPLPTGNVANGDMAGTEWAVMVLDPETGNSCMATGITFLDKLAPTISCTDATINCMGAIDNVPAPVAQDNCDDDLDVQLVSQWFEDDEFCDEDGIKIFKREWIAVDDNGLTSETCVQTIEINRIEIDFPADITWSCDQYANHHNVIEAIGLNPFIADADTNDDDIDVPVDLAEFVLTNTGSGVPTGYTNDNSYCEFNISYSDEILDHCGPGTFKIIRTWVMLDLCNNDVSYHDQLIIVDDQEGPTLTFNNDAFEVEYDDEGNLVSSTLTVSANVRGDFAMMCRSTAFILAPSYDDNCSGVVSMQIFTGAGELVNYQYDADGKVIGGFIPEPGLSIGEHYVLYQVFDACGNVSEIIATIDVVDDITPDVVCEGHRQVSLNNTGTNTVYAAAFDDGTTDNCCIDHFEVRRMDGGSFGPSVSFDCSDIGTTVYVIFEAIDCYDNASTCMVEVEVVDKSKPTCSAPSDMNLTCLDLPGDLDINDSDVANEYFGTPYAIDNCNAEIQYLSVNDSRNECGVGSITRRFRARDTDGNLSGVCLQTIEITEVHDYTIHIPADPHQTVDCTMPNVNALTVDSEGCDIIATDVYDQVLDISDDGACYMIRRTYTILNECVWNGFDEAVVLERLDPNHDGLANSRTIHFAGTDLEGGYYTYIQYIRVDDEVAPTVSYSGDTEFCAGLTTEHGEAPCEGYVELPISYEDACTDDLSVTWILFDDVDGDGYFITAAPHNDVPLDNGYDIFSGNLEVGHYGLAYYVEDGCGNTAEQIVIFDVKDCQHPTISCDELVVELMNTTPPMFVITPDMFLQPCPGCGEAVTDNCSTDLPISFSADVNDVERTLTCDNYGVHNTVEIWATDAAGNQTFCVTQVIVQANDSQGCDDDDPHIGGLIATEAGVGVEGVAVQLNGGANYFATTNTDGMYDVSVENGADYSIAPVFSDDTHDYVSTMDLVVIRDHILNPDINGFTSGYQWIASDVNNSHSVTGLDMVEIRRYILWDYTIFPDVNSWAFVDANYRFDSEEPFAGNIPSVININNISTDKLNADFVAIVMGDLDGSYENSLLGNEDRSVGEFILNTKDAVIKAGETYTVDFTAEDLNLAGYQFTLSFDNNALDFESIVPGVAKKENFGLSFVDDGFITTSWNGDANDDEILFSVMFMAKADGQLSDMLEIASRYTKAEAYGQDKERKDIKLHFSSGIVADGFALYQNRPNPFSDYTTIGFDLPEASMATLTITDISGKVIKVINGDFAKGYNKIDISKLELSGSGVLNYRLETNDHVSTKKMIMIR